MNRVFAPFALLAVLGFLGACGAPQAADSSRAQLQALEESFGADEWRLLNSPMAGNPLGQVTIVAFSDFECPFCARVTPTLRQILEAEEFDNQVRVVFKHLPLSFHPNAFHAAEASMEAHAQGKFWEFHDLLFDNQDALSRADMARYAEQLGLDMEAFNAAMEAGTWSEWVSADLQLSSDLGIRGTPNFLINGRELAGAQPYDNFAALIREELAAMAELVDQELSLGEALAQRTAINQAAGPVPQPPRPMPDPSVRMYVPVGESATYGPEDALVTLVMLSDFECSYCARVQDTLGELLANYRGDLRVVYKHLPLSFHEHASSAALASMAVQAQGRFWAFSNHVFANQDRMDDSDLLEIAERLGLDMERFIADWVSTEAADRLNEDRELARRLGVTGTPHFFINGFRLRGAQPYETFATMVEAALEEARELLESGVSRDQIYDHVMQDAERGDAPIIYVN